MKKNVLIANAVVWAILLAGCVAFQVWYRSGEVIDTYYAVMGSAFLQVMAVESGPVILFAVGALLGLLFVGLKKIKLGRGARNALRVVSVLFLAVLVLSLVPMLFGIGLTAPVVIVVYLGMAAPAVIVILGFLYAMGLAEADPSKKGPFAKYLPDDDE